MGGRIEFFQINLVQIITNLKRAITEIKLLPRIGLISSHLHLTTEELHHLYLSNQRSLKRASQRWLVRYKISQQEGKICRKAAGSYKIAESHAIGQLLAKNRVLAIIRELNNTKTMKRARILMINNFVLMQ